MCGRYAILSPPEAMRQAFGDAEQPNFPLWYNIAPTQPVPVIIRENGARHFRLMRWGLIPAWVKDPRQFALVINARAETVLDKPAFKNAMKRRRCLPADGYYEWHQSEGRKRPFFIRQGNGGLIGFAGLSETLGRAERRRARYGRHRHHGGAQRSRDPASACAGDGCAWGLCALARRRRYRCRRGDAVAACWLTANSSGMKCRRA